MNRREALDGLQLQQNAMVDNDVKAVTSVQVHTFVHKGQRTLSFQYESTVLKFPTQTLAVG